MPLGIQCHSARPSSWTEKKLEMTLVISQNEKRNKKLSHDRMDTCFASHRFTQVCEGNLVPTPGVCTLLMCMPVEYFTCGPFSSMDPSHTSSTQNSSGEGGNTRSARPRCWCACETLPATRFLDEQRLASDVHDVDDVWRTLVRHLVETRALLKPSRSVAVHCSRRACWHCSKKRKMLLPAVQRQWTLGCSRKGHENRNNTCRNSTCTEQLGPFSHCNW